jgi:putative heme-binding domain-containing protein
MALTWWVLLQATAVGDPVAPLQMALESLTMPAGFRVELVYSVPLQEQGSWVALTPDPSGRLITSDEHGRLYRVTIGSHSSKTTAARLDVPVGQVQGLLYAYDSLYVVVNNQNNTAGDDIAQISGLYRLQDTDGDDQFDRVTLLQQLDGTGTENAHGEHGPHAVVLGPDGHIYFVTGNGIKVPEQTEPSSPYRNWADDLLVPSENTYVPGGWIARTNRTGTKWELLCGGLRNPYDIAFNLDGELFTCDADSEADTGTHWYRPARVNHIVSGGEYGWRCDTGSWVRYGKWPDHYPDSVGSVVDIGRGSPAGITFGTGARFPARYQRALYVCDWQTATIYAVHLQQDGASYRGTLESFLTGKGMPLTDLVVHPDGAMYFTVGGRKTESGLFRIRYVGSEPTAPVKPTDVPRASQSRQLRRRLEGFHGREDPRAVDEAWPHLASGDRAIRYAARIAVEHQYLTLWKDRALREERTVASIQAMLALARVGGPELQQQVLGRLNRLPLEQLGEAQLREVVRAYSLGFIRMGGKGDNVGVSVIARLESRLESLFPSVDSRLNRELCKLLVYLDAPVVVEGALDLIRTAPSAEEKSFYIAELSRLTCDWSFSQRRILFSLTGPDALAEVRGNERTMGLIRVSRQAAVAQLSDEDKRALQEAIDGRAEQNRNPPPEADPDSPRPAVKDWQLEEVLSLVSGVEGGRSYRNGKAAYEAATCAKCHQVAGDGGTTGPDLTAVGNRFNLRYLLEALIVPSKVVSDRYRNETIATEDGRVFTGRVVYDDGRQLRIRTDPTTRRSIEVAVDKIESRTPSDVSEMPRGLINVLTEEELLDLIAYLRAGGNEDDAAFE